ncbi:MAG: hypothetical protein IIA90_01520, partial [Chloroflexi bacterium]|nr:hypothetical protein [Chloroflexota bacterium]
GAPELPARFGVPAEAEAGRLLVSSEDPTQALYELTRWATEHAVELGELTVSRPSLEDVYLKLTKEAEGRAGEA